MKHGFLPFVPAVVLAVGCSSVQVSADFEGGSIGRFQVLGPHRVVCAVAGQADHEGRNRQPSWYYFRVDNVQLREIEVTLDDLVGEYDYRPGTTPITDKTPPLISYDQQKWEHVPTVRWDPETKRLHIPLKPAAATFWLAHLEPYTPTRLERLLEGFASERALRQERIGTTVENRPLRLLTVTSPDHADETKAVVWLMFRQHAWETGSSFVAEGLLSHLLAPESRDLLGRVVFKIFPMMDPDGCARGGVRFNRNGYDLNRNWDTCDPYDPASRAKMPEIAAAKAAMTEWLGRGGRMDLFLTHHNQETGGWLSGSASFPAVADRLFKLLQRETSCNLPERSPRGPSAKPAPGRATVYYWLEHEKKVPAFLIEQGVAFDERLMRIPTADDRRLFGRELARAVARVVLER
ncbi:MAG TPA: M14-type cytosolic carboxypeptidase [Planctomycetota bacterium]|nr:M14-type cytosolic carboxypeptidase [Planctomycetota bacterium]